MIGEEQAMAANIYTTKQGDMWDAISYAVYGNEYLMHVIMDANPSYVSIVIFPAGITLFIPDIPSTIPQNLPPWKRVKV